MAHGPRSGAWNSLAWQSASIAGPALGGFLVAIAPGLSYGVALALYIAAAISVALIRGNAQPEVQPGSRWALMKEGLSYVWTNKIVFGAISLDLAAVILAGATAMLPVYARDVLHVGPEGFGFLRAASAVGATAMALWRRRPGVRGFSRRVSSRWEHARPGFLNATGRPLLSGLHVGEDHVSSPAMPHYDDLAAGDVDRRHGLAGEGEVPGRAARGGGDLEDVAGAEILHRLDRADSLPLGRRHGQADQVGQVEFVLIR
eukprot:gene1024-1390_t